MAIGIGSILMSVLMRSCTGSDGWGSTYLRALPIFNRGTKIPQIQVVGRGSLGIIRT